MAKAPKTVMVLAMAACLVLLAAVVCGRPVPAGDTGDAAPTLVFEDPPAHVAADVVPLDRRRRGGETGEAAPGAAPGAPGGGAIANLDFMFQAADLAGWSDDAILEATLSAVVKASGLSLAHVLSASVEHDMAQGHIIVHIQVPKSKEEQLAEAALQVSINLKHELAIVGGAGAPVSAVSFSSRTSNGEGSGDPRLTPAVTVGLVVGAVAVLIVFVTLLAFMLRSSANGMPDTEHVGVPASGHKEGSSPAPAAVDDDYIDPATLRQAGTGEDYEAITGFGGEDQYIDPATLRADNTAAATSEDAYIDPATLKGHGYGQDDDAVELYGTNEEAAAPPEPDAEEADEEAELTAPSSGVYGTSTGGGLSADFGALVSKSVEQDFYETVKADDGEALAYEEIDDDDHAYEDMDEEEEVDQTTGHDYENIDDPAAGQGQGYVEMDANGNAVGAGYTEMGAGAPGYVATADLRVSAERAYKSVRAKRPPKAPAKDPPKATFRRARSDKRVPANSERPGIKKSKSVFSFLLRKSSQKKSQKKSTKRKGRRGTKSLPSTPVPPEAEGDYHDYEDVDYEDVDKNSYEDIDNEGQAHNPESTYEQPVPVVGSGHQSVRTKAKMRARAKLSHMSSGPANAQALSGDSGDPPRLIDQVEVERQGRGSDVWNALSDMKFEKGATGLEKVRQSMSIRNTKAARTTAATATAPAPEKQPEPPLLGSAQVSQPESPEELGGITALTFMNDMYEVPDAVLRPKWVHGLISRDEAIRYVSDKRFGGGRKGSFLFRCKREVDTYAVTMFLGQGRFMHNKVERKARGWIMNDQDDTPIVGPQANITEVMEMLADQKGRFQLDLKHPISCHKPRLRKRESVV